MYALLEIQDSILKFPNSSLFIASTSHTIIASGYVIYILMPCKIVVNSVICKSQILIKLHGEKCKIESIKKINVHSYAVDYICMTIL